MKNADRIVLELQQRPALDDDELANRIGIIRQTVNQECRLLASKGLVVRERGGPRGKLVNRLRDRTGADFSARRIDCLGSGNPASERAQERASVVEGMALAQFGSYEFEQVCLITPERDADGAIKTPAPQSRYRNARSIPVNKYGRGPFCKFRIPAKY